MFRPFKSMVSPSDVWRQVAAAEGKSGQAPDGIALFGLDNKRVREEIKNASKYDCCARPCGRGAPFRAPPPPPLPPPLVLSGHAASLTPY